MKQKYIKIMIIFLVACIIPINACVMAVEVGLGDLSNYAKEQGTSEKFTDMVGTILGVVQTAGSIISVVCLIVLGIKYMMGSVEEKANYKKTLVPYVLGAIMVLGISNFINIIYQIATGMF